MGVDAQAAPGDGPPRPRPAVRGRGGRRDLRRRRQHRTRAAPAATRSPVMVAVEKTTETGRKLGRMRLEVAQRPGTPELVEFASAMVEPGSTIRTDGARMLRRLAELGYTHEYTPGYNAPDKAERAARGAPGRLTAQALADRHPALRRRRAPPALLPRRVHLPVQPPQRQQPRPALLPTPPASRRHRPAPAADAPPARDQYRTSVKQIPRTCVRTWWLVR